MSARAYKPVAEVRALKHDLMQALDGRNSEMRARMAVEAELTAERTRRLAAEDIVDRSLAHFPEKKLRALAHGYRTQYPRVEEEQ